MIDLSATPRLLLFDGVCTLCNRSVQFVILHDPTARFKFAPLQSEIGQAMLERVGLSQSELDTFVYLRNGVAYVRSDAALYTLRDLGFPWNWLFALIVLPKFLRDHVYNTVAGSRYRLFGRTEACMIPTGDLKSRFL